MIMIKEVLKEELNDDIYIMMQCLSVTKHHHYPLRAERRRRETRRPQGLAGRTPALE